MKKGDLVNILNNYDISRFCDKCEIEKTKMVRDEQRPEWLICPRCGWSCPIFGKSGNARLRDKDSGEPMIAIVGGEHEDKTLEDKLISELKKKGMSDIRITRL